MMDKNNMQNNLKLQQTIRFFETLLRASADGIVITDPASNIIFVNDTFCKFFSSNRHDVIETNLFVWLAKLDHNAKDIWKGLETQINEHGIAKDIEFAMKTGERMRYFSVNSSLLEKIDIEEEGLIISIWRDDTERKMVELALLQAHDELEMRVKVRTAQLTNTNIELISEINERARAEKDLEEAIIKTQNEKNKSESIIAALGDAISIQDTDFKVLYQNKIHQEIAGDQKGRYCYREYEHRDNICDGCPVNRSFKDGKIHTEERSIIKDGQRLYFDIKSSPLRDSTGKIIAGIEIARDITEQKRAEKERIQLIEREHEARVEVEAARKLDSMKSMFLASTSHELRTPLNSIIGFTSLILDGVSGELNPEQKEQLEIVHSSGKHLLALINDIIDLSQMEAGRKNVEVSEFNLREVVEEAFSILNIILMEKKLEIKIEVGDILMKSDRRRLLQCLVNLLGNAIKYTEKGSVEITAKVIDNNIEISVTDTGIGIKTKDIPKLFGPFVRLQSPLTLKTSGTGLGLYLIKKLATDFLGGDVEVESEYGKGSTFTLHVPVELEGVGRQYIQETDFID